MQHVKCYKKGYPRPQFVRGEYKLLDGEWNFLTDTEDKGIKEEYFKSFPASERIIVPFAYGTRSSECANKTSSSIVWYNRLADFSDIANRQKALLNFEGSDYFTMVWINGQFAGENRGAYHRFSFDITHFLKDGKADITVRVEDNYDTHTPRGKQKWQDKPFGCWYTETTGIFKSVWAEFCSSAYIDNVKITPVYKDNSVKFDYTVLMGNKKELVLKTIISYKEELVSEFSICLTRERFSNTINICSKADPFGVQLWNEHNPSLYDVEYILYEDSKEIDKIGSYFGFREFRTVKDSIILNDTAIYLRMLLDQGYYPNGFLTGTEEQIAFDVQKTKELGFNGIRKHQKIEDDRFYYYCDVLGIYAWLEMPSFYEFSDHALQAFTEEWIRIVSGHVNHPCIMAYVPFNESWGITRIKTNLLQQSFTQGIYYLTKALTDGAIVISNDGWEHTRSDIITLHNYEQDGEKLKAYFNALDKILQNEKIPSPNYKLCFSDGFNYEGQPVVLSEFAGIAFQKDRSGNNWGYGLAVKDGEEFLLRLKSQIEAIASCKRLSGFCFTQTTDVEHEVNGIMDFERRVKVNEKELRKIILTDM